jgi:hypothetical protein
MALKPCRECKKKVSTEAVTCPSCGVPNPTQKKIVVAKKKINPWGKDKTTRDQSWRKTLGIENLDDEQAKNKLNKENIVIKKDDSSETSWERFMDGKLDLKTAFWGYGFFGSIVIGVICGFLSEAVGSFFILVYIITVVVLILGLWQCASNYKKQMAQKKESELWGVLTHIYCVVAALGLANFIKDFI